MNAYRNNGSARASTSALSGTMKAGSLAVGIGFLWLASCDGPSPPVFSEAGSAGRVEAAGRSAGGHAGRGAAGKGAGGTSAAHGGTGAVESAAGAGEGGILGAAGASGAPNTTGGSGGAAGDGAAGEGGAGQAGAGGKSTALCHSTRATTPVLPAPSELDPDEVALAALVIGSCWDDDGVNRNASHLWHSHLATSRFYYRVGSQISCVIDANCGCDAIDHCFGMDIGPLPSCEQGCNGATFTGCGAGVDLIDGYGVTFDCDSVGLTCDPLAICTDGPAASCDYASFVAGCTGDGRPEYCDDGVVWYGQACGDIGLACAAGACVGTGGDCDESVFGDGEIADFTGVGCVGDTLQACVVRKTATLDCTTQGPGFGCHERDGKFFCGLGDECVPASEGSDSGTPASCDGTVLTFCNAGRLEHIDCTDHGFSGCNIDRAKGHYGCVPRQFE